MRVGVEDEERVDTFWVTRGPVQTDRPAPVVGHDRRPTQVEGLQERFHSLGVSRDAIQRGIARLVGAAEAEVVGHDGSVSGLDERRDEIAIQIAPGRIAVDHDHRPPIPRTDVDEMHAAVGRVEPLWLEWPCTVEGPIRHASHNSGTLLPSALVGRGRVRKTIAALSELPMCRSSRWRR